jgi:hypothetical protein
MLFLNYKGTILTDECGMQPLFMQDHKNLKATSGNCNGRNLEKLRQQLNSPITDKYRENFWAKKYHNENILNLNKKNHYSLDEGFCSYYGLDV